MRNHVDNYQKQCDFTEICEMQFSSYVSQIQKQKDMNR